MMDLLRVLLIYPLAFLGMALLELLLWDRMEGLGDIDE